jgi:PAS domain S-box-containing protein
MNKKLTLFHNEEKILENATNVLEQFKDQEIPLVKEYQSLFKAYKKLLKQTKFLVTVSDKQHNQLSAKTEKVARASEEKLAQFLEAIPVGVFVVDASGHSYYANQKAQHIFGKNIVPTTTIQEFSAIYQFHLAGSTQLYPIEHNPLTQALQGKISSVDDIEIHQGNKIVPIEMWGIPIVDEKNNLTYAIAAFQDITERKQAEQERIRFTQELQASEERFRVIAETTPVPLVIIHTADGAILYANTQATFLFGLSISQLTSQRITDFYPEHPGWKRLLRTFLRHQELSNYEIQLNKANGTSMWVNLFIQPMVFNGEPALLTAIYDITERKQIEEERMGFTQELEELNVAYERFVPHQFLSFLNKCSIVEVELGDQVAQEMTVLFSDVRDFTTLSEQMTPQENFNFINSYLSKMEPIISKHHGFIDKYIGDAIMALFPTSADDAVCGSIAMLKELVEYNQGRHRAGYQPIRIGIGLNSGPLMLGTVGGRNRMDSTVISDAVNLASRIEGMSKKYGAALLISEATYSRLRDATQYAIRIIDRVKVKGKSASVTIYEVFDHDPPHLIELKMQTRNRFERGLICYRQKAFHEATLCFSENLRIHNGDKAAQIYLQRCEYWQQHGVPESWEGIEAMTDK